MVWLAWAWTGQGRGREERQWHLVLTADMLFTDQVLLYGCVLVLFLTKYFNLQCENVLLCILLSASLTCSQKANFHVYPVLSMDNKVSCALSTYVLGMNKTKYSLHWICKCCIFRELAELLLSYSYQETSLNGQSKPKQLLLKGKRICPMAGHSALHACTFTSGNYSLKFKGSELVWKFFISFLPGGHQEFSKGHIKSHSSQLFLKMKIQISQGQPCWLQLVTWSNCFAPHSLRLIKQLKHQ